MTLVLYGKKEGVRGGVKSESSSCVCGGGGNTLRPVICSELRPNSKVKEDRNVSYQDRYREKGPSERCEKDGTETVSRTTVRGM